MNSKFKFKFANYLQKWKEYIQDKIFHMNIGYDKINTFSDWWYQNYFYMLFMMLENPHSLQ